MGIEPENPKQTSSQPRNKKKKGWIPCDKLVTIIGVKVHTTSDLTGKWQQNNNGMKEHLRFLCFDIWRVAKHGLKPSDPSLDRKEKQVIAGHS